MTRKGFTLAETLITIGIIGVVAAMTLPTLTAKYRQEVALSKIKKMYSVMSQTMLMTVVNQGDYSGLQLADNSQTSINNWYKNAIDPYLKTNKVCYNSVGCWAESTKNLDGLIPSYFSASRGIGQDIVAVTTTDGYNISFDAWGRSTMRFGVDTSRDSTSMLLIFVDINGNDKPNVVGQDTFVLVFLPERGLVSAGRDASNEVVNQNCSKNAVTSGDIGAGMYCLEKIIRNGWKIDKENLW